MVQLTKFIAFIFSIIVLYIICFHLLMPYEGREFSWVTGVSWTLTVMSTLYFGDITFSNDLGLLFTIMGLGAGVILLLIMLPFSFIQFFYAPWLILGGGRVGLAVAEKLEEHHISDRIVEKRPNLAAGKGE